VTEYTNVICGIGLPDDDKAIEEVKCVDITIGVFFDGTCNNKYNIDSGKKREGSYLGTYTNVAHLWNEYVPKGSFDSKVYIEGIATNTPVPKSKDEELRKLWKDGKVDIADEDLKSSGEKDDMMEGSAFGFGSNGINAKIERACKLVKLRIDNAIKGFASKQTTLRTITFDIFGFSRGAAAARSFASRLNDLVGNVGTEDEKRMVRLKKDYLYEAVFEGTKIKVRFMGLFDTVSSFNPGLGLAPGKEFANDVKELGLDIPACVSKVVHLVAADEYREYFALTTVLSAGHKGMEILLPGAHSDIGGGYRANESEEIYMSATWYRNPGRGFLSLDDLIGGNWLPHGREKWHERDCRR
jgi:hypothetical protein